MGLKDWLGGSKKKGAQSSSNPEAVLEQIAQLRRMGRLEEARKFLVEALQNHPNDADLLRTHWEVCVQREQPEDGVRSILRCIQLELRKGERQAGVFHWFELQGRLEEPPAIDFDTRIRLAEAMLEEDHAEEAARLLESSHENLDPSLPLGILIRLAKAALRSRSASGEALVSAVLQRPGLPDPFRAEIDQLYEQAQEEGFRSRSTEEPEDSPIELSSAAPAVRKLRVIGAVPLAVDGDQISLELVGQGRRKMALAQVQGLAAARIDDGMSPAWVLIDLLLDSLWSDQELIRTVRLRTQDFDPLALMPEAGDSQLALMELISNLLAISQAHPLPDSEAAVGRPFHGFTSVREYEVKVLEVTL